MNRAGGGYWSYCDDVAQIITPTTGDQGIGIISMARTTSNFFDSLFPDADGDGYSLVFVGSDPTHGPDWCSSVGLGGNPGSTDSFPSEEVI